MFQAVIERPRAEAFTVPQRCGLLVVFALLVMCRLPLAWFEGRFQAEEATVFLAYAWHYPWADVLFRPFAGYLNIAANGTTLLVARLVQGSIVPLEVAPYLTMMMALAAQMLPAVLILTGKADWLSNRLAVVGALLMLAMMPATEEVFFNVLHIQFHLALCVGLILALDVPTSRVAKVGYGAILFLAPLCGPAAIVLLPLFALRAIVDRDRIWLLAPLAVGAAIQLLLFYGDSPVRGHLLDPMTLASAMFVRLVALPLAGIDLANMIGMIRWLAPAAVVVFGALLVVASRRKDGAIWLILASLSLAAVSFGYGMVVVNDLFDVADGERYNFLPLMFLGLAMIVMATRGSRACAVLCGLALFWGAFYYTEPHQVASGPSWRAEVAAWRADRNHHLVVWPDSYWAADLSGEAKPCSPPNQVRPDDPLYCESSWRAEAHQHN